MNNKVGFIFVVLALAQYSQCRVIDKAILLPDYGDDIDFRFARSYERIQLLDKIAEDFLKEVTSTSTEISAESLQELTEGVEELKNEIKHELTSYYDDLKAESLKNNELPDPSNHLIEVKLLDILPKYIDEAIGEFVQAVNEEEELSAEDKALLVKHITKLTHILKSDVIVPIKSEIAAHPEAWLVLDPIYYIANDEELDDDKITPEVEATVEKLDDILSDALVDNALYFAELYEDIKKFAEANGYGDIFESSEEWYNSNEDLLYNTIDRRRRRK